MSRRLAASVLALLLIAASACVMPVRTPERHLIPEGYVGWVRAYFGVAGAPPLPTEDGHLLLRYPEGGMLETSSERSQGLATDEYYYVSGGKRRLLSTSSRGGEGMIWGKHEGLSTERREGGEITRSGAHVAFFVGPYEQYEQHRQGPGSLPPIPPIPPIPDPPAAESEPAPPSE
jgi:hypothetical protein